MPPETVPPIPGLESPEPETDPPTVPLGDFSLPPETTLPDDPSFVGAPVQPGPVVERTFSSTTYDNGDGTSTVRLHKNVINFEDETGVWRAIDSRIEADTDEGDYRMISGPFEARFGAETGSGPILKVAQDDWSIAFLPVGLTAGRHAEVSGRRVTYPGVGPSTDLLLDAGTDQVKETFRINAPLPLDHVPRFRSEVDLEGVVPKPAAHGGIDFVDSKLGVVASIPVGLATDSNLQHDAVGMTPRTPVVPVATKTADGWAVDLTVDLAWVRSPERVHPIFVDPTVRIQKQWQAGRDAGGADIVVGSGCGDCRYDGENQIEAGEYTNRIGRSTHTPPGTNATGEWEWYTYLFYDLAPVMLHTVTRAHMTAHFWGAHSYPGMAEQYPANFTMWPIAQPWDASNVTWGTRPNHRAERVDLQVLDGYSAIAVDLTNWAQNWASGAWPAWGIAFNTAGENRYVRMASTEDRHGWDPWIDIVIQNTVPYHTQSQLVPAHGSTVTTLTPTLSAPVLTDSPENDTIKYWFRIGTIADAEAGLTVNSGWQPTPTFKLPPGALKDGTTYYWKVFTRDQLSSPTPTVSSWPPAELLVDLRLGTGGPSPYDAVGPVTANLATGNATFTASSPTFQTVGGPIGVDFTYNSAAPSATGLQGVYVDAADNRNTLVRRDTALDFKWNTSPGPGIPAEYWSATWTGNVRVPTGGDWAFGALHDDTVKISVGSPYVVKLDKPCCANTSVAWGSRTTFGAGQRLPVKVQFTNAAGPARLQLWADGPGPNGTRITTIVPADWLSTGSGILPAGWSMSSLTLDSLMYARALLNDDSVVLVGPEGDTHKYKKQSDGTTWKPTNDADDTVVSTTENGATRLVVEADDGLTYTFDGSGKLIRVRSSLDEDGQTSPEYEIDSATGNLTGIEDPVSGRKLTLTYSPATGGAGSCTTTGFSTPPAGSLCKLTHPDGATSKLFYNANGQLARIEDPGAEITDFAYDTGGRLAKIRDPLAHDAVSAASPHNWPNDDTTRTVLAYDSSRRVASVTAPVAQRNATTRMAHTFSYTSGSESRVTVAGITPPTGQSFARRVTFDQAGREVTDTGLDGLTESKEWELAADRVLASTDTTGRKTTTIYDHAGRATDTYGPAPASWFGADRLPVASRVADVPRSRTAYDEGMRGLSARFWDNATLSGPAKLNRLGIGEATGKLWADWDTASPTGLGAVDNFSARFTGEITFPASGYKVEGCADDGIRVWIDDERVVNRWTSVGCTASTWTSPDNKPHRIRVEYKEGTGNADVGLWWVPPGGTRVLVPGANLAPRYGLVTSTVDPDGKKTATRYSDPERGLATASVVDPDGERLATETAYEPAGVGYRRQVGKRMPGSDYASHVRADAPAAHWRLNEHYAATTAVDSSGNGRHAAYPSNAELGGDGVTGFDNGVKIRGGGVSAGDVFDFAGTAAFSVEAWVKLDATGTGWRLLLSKEATDANGRQGWLLWANNNTFGFERWQNGSAHGTSGGAWRPGQWTHVVVSFDGTAIRLYVNGTQVAAHTSTSPKSLLDTTAPMYVGADFRGAIDEAAVYTTALSTSRIREHWRAANYYLHGALLDPTGAYWRLTEDGGTTALDASGNGRNATYGTGVTLGQGGVVAPDTAAATNGGTIATAGDVLDFDGTTMFSLESWVKPTTTDGTTRRILSKEVTDVAGRQGWSLWTKNGKVGFERIRDGEADTVEGGSLTVGRWHHVAARFSGNTMRLYLDGEEVGLLETTRSILNTTGELRLGDGFKGSMAHAAVYTVTMGATSIRRHYRDGIAQRSTGTLYYLPTESRVNPCPAGGSASQAGLARLSADPDPDGTSAGIGRFEETVHDNVGRPVATRLYGEAWSCTTYDSRGRVSQRTVPAFGTEAARTTTFNYSVGGNPLVSSITDGDGTTTTTVTTTVDLLGRVVSQVDTWNKATTTTYDQAGRVTQTDGPGGRIGTDYRANGWVDAQRLAGSKIAVPSYNAVGEVTGVSYPAGTGNVGNGTSHTIVRDTASGRPTKLTWTQAGGGLLASDEVAHTLGGKVRDQKVDGVDHHAGDDFAYDGAERLVAAWVPGHELTYAFAGSNSCGQSATAGRNTNRTAATDNGTTRTYCYDTGDKLTSTTDPRYATIAYDSRHNVTTLGDETLVYDGANNHVATTKGGTTVRYVRDGLGRIVERKVNGTTAARYSYGGSDDSPDAVLDATNAVVEMVVPLLGGVLVTTRAVGDVWSYPNLHGDVMATTNPAGAKVGDTFHYDPYGQPLATAPDNAAGNFDYGWLGRHQRPLETEAGITTIEMGARPYVPGLGRFLEVDPVEGGSANDYDYANADPVNSFDLDGNWPRCKWCRKQWNRAKRGVRAAGRWTYRNRWRFAGYAAAGACIGLSAGWCAGAVGALWAAKTSSTGRRYGFGRRSWKHHAWNTVTSASYAFPGLAASRLGLAGGLRRRVLWSTNDLACASFRRCASPGFPY